MQPVERLCIDKEELRAMSEERLAGMGVRMSDRESAELECVACGQTWLPETDSAGKLAFHYWACPSKCNER